MLSEQMKQEVRELVTSLLQEHRPQVRKEDQQAYIDSVQFALGNKADKRHDHKYEDIRDRYPSLDLIVRRDGDKGLVMEVTVSKVRGYCMAGALIGITTQCMDGEESSKAAYTDSQPFIIGELLYKFTLPASVYDSMPIKVMAFMRDINDPEVEVRTGYRILSVGKTQDLITNDQTQ